MLLLLLMWETSVLLKRCRNKLDFIQSMREPCRKPRTSIPTVKPFTYL
jgi:hypothetical protein